MELKGISMENINNANIICDSFVFVLHNLQPAMAENNIIIPTPREVSNRVLRKLLR
jgi:hypothetical protein